MKFCLPLPQDRVRITNTTISYQTVYSHKKKKENTHTKISISRVLDFDSRYTSVGGPKKRSLIWLESNLNLMFSYFFYLHIPTMLCQKIIQFLPMPTMLGQNFYLIFLPTPCTLGRSILDFGSKLDGLIWPSNCCG